MPIGGLADSRAGADRLIWLETFRRLRALTRRVPGFFPFPTEDEKLAGIRQRLTRILRARDSFGFPGLDASRGSGDDGQAAEGSREDSRSIPRPDGTVDRKSPSRPTESHDPILVARQSIHDGHFEVGPGDYYVPRVSCEWCSRKRARAEIPAQSVLREHRFVLEPEQSQQAVLSSRLSTESRPGISSRFRPDVPSGIGASEMTERAV